MCGIVGVVSGKPVDFRLLERMRDQLVHRGPDAAGLWQSEDGRVSLGHRRLAIIDLSANANQPFVSADRRSTVPITATTYSVLSCLARSMMRSSSRATACVTP